MSFSVGTSSTPMDMSLDDMIAKRRTSTRKKPSKAAEATGQGKAQRQAAANARRGISKSTKPSKMDVDKQVNRQQKNQQKGNNNNRGGRGNNAGRRATAPSAASVRAKAANKGKGNNANNANTNNNQGAIQAPSQQAISAAARAMKDNGFKPPKGMQMQISFVPKQTPNNNNNNNNNQGGGKKQGNNNNNNNNQGKQGRGRGRGPRR
mmetsp:Transcript_27410/g.65176  ORF Transcript_27410/g.65176 Transcript_27410/m.65176 type:complete len:207 (-) Transcript_27410:3833-4453(-)